MGGKALGDNFTVPIWDRHVFGMFRYAIPERLDVFEFLVRGEFVEPGRRNGWLRHVSVYDGPNGDT